jgi:hypothetical protein
MRTICLTLPVRNLQVSKAFFAELGFTFSPAPAGADTVCMTIDQNIFVMLVAEDWFRARAGGEILPAGTGARVVTGVSVGSQQEVDQTVAKAIAAGGQPWPIIEDRPVYSGSFADLDGHVWQLTCPPPGSPDIPRQFAPGRQAREAAPAAV